MRFELGRQNKKTVLFAFFRTKINRPFRCDPSYNQNFVHHTSISVADANRNYLLR
jgi:hypothetical protein